MILIRRRQVEVALLRCAQQSGGLRSQERLPVDHGNSEIRSAELAHHCKIDSYDFALIVEKRTARTPEVVWAS